MLILDELVTYKINAKGCLNCRLSENALKKLRRFRTSLKEVGYNFETDTPYVKVRTPLPAPVKIHLKRQNDTMDRIASEQSSLLLAADGEEKESDGELNEQSLR